MGQRLSEHSAQTLVETADIGGTNATSGWVSMKNFSRAMAYVEIGTWDAADDLDECRLEQGITSAGTSAKDLTTDAAAGNYDTSNPVDADGDFVIIEVRSENLDIDLLFDHIRVYLAEGGNTGVDNVTSVLNRYGNAYPAKEKNGAAVTGSRVYVQPS